jgi:hypothetical protein
LGTTFIEILKQLAPPHAFLLDIFYEQVDRNKLACERWSENGYSLSTLREYLRNEVCEFDVAVQNLLRLRLVAEPTANLGVANGNEVRVQLSGSDILYPTRPGQAFVGACGRGRNRRAMSYSVPGNCLLNLFWTRGVSVKIAPQPSA